MKKLYRALLVALGVFAVFETVMVVAFHFKNERLIRLIKRFNREILNPIMLDYSGSHGFYAATLHHLGRKSQTPYSTPVYATPIPDGFIIPLPYGTDVDWLKNVMADGVVRLDYDGISHHAETPEIVPAATVDQHVPTRWRTRLRFFNNEYFLKVKSSTSPGTT